MERNLSVNVEFLTRVEGHGHIVVDVAEGVLKSCRLEIVEAPRFFEAMLVGRSIFEAQHITSRICGICACGHTLASIEAAEEAIGFVPSPQTVSLRKLLLCMENLDSHILHIHLLVAPDLLGVQSFLGLLPQYGDVVRRTLRMKKACNDVCDIFVGRHVHPISAVIGGFTKLPGSKELERMRTILLQIRDDLPHTVDLLSTIKFPLFERQTEYVALAGDGKEYPMLSGEIASSDGMRFSKTAWSSVTNEFLVPHSTAKHARLSRSSYMVGALARFNLNYAGLHPRAKEVAKSLNLSPPCYNPYMNTAAQLVECIHCTEEAIAIVEDLLSAGIDPSEALVVGVNENRAVPVKAGSGVGAVEVPRGLLFHHYDVDEEGIITRADCVIPTGQNLHNIEDDMRKLVPEILSQSEAEITRSLEMLVRAYDPCISCSTHLLKIDYVR